VKNNYPDLGMIFMRAGFRVFLLFTFMFLSFFMDRDLTDVLIIGLFMFVKFE